MTEVFRCASCGETFPMVGSEEAREREAVSAVGLVFNHKVEVVCDVCYVALKDWLKLQGQPIRGQMS